MDKSFIERLYRIRKNEFKMMQDRNYEPIEQEKGFDDINLLKDRKAWKQAVKNEISKGDNLLGKFHFDYESDDGFVLVQYLMLKDKKQIGKALVEEFIKKLDSVEGDNKLGILIHFNNFSPDAKKILAIDHSNSGTYDIQVFEASELEIDPTNYIYSQEYQLIEKEKQDELLAAIGCHARQLNVLRMEDPIRRWYNYPPNRIVKVLRDDFEIEMVNKHSANYRYIPYS